MKEDTMLGKLSLNVCIFIVLTFAALAQAAQPWTFDNNTRYLAMGDSLTAGQGATPVTQGYAYQLYEQGFYDSMPNTTFANVAMPGATSQQVLNYQVPSATQSGFSPHVITMTVGGNDLLSILNGADPAVVLSAFGGNLSAILVQLCTQLPATTRIYVGNLYVIQNFPVPTEQVVNGFSQVVAGVVGSVNGSVCAGRVKVADIYAQFAGRQGGLLLINRNGAGQFEVHPSNAGHRAIAQAFIAAR